MIQITVTHKSRMAFGFKSQQDLARIRIHRIDKGGKKAEDGAYSVETVVERGGAWGFASRVFHFRRLEGNVLALIYVALAEFLDNEEVFRLDDVSSVVERKRSRAMPEIQDRQG